MQHILPDKTSINHTATRMTILGFIEHDPAVFFDIGIEKTSICLLAISDFIHLAKVMTTDGLLKVIVSVHLKLQENLLCEIPPILRHEGRVFGVQELVNHCTQFWREIRTDMLPPQFKRCSSDNMRTLSFQQCGTEIK